MTTYVINGENYLTPVEIVYPDTEDQRRDTVFIQSKGKAKLPAGSAVARGFLFEHPRVTTHTVDAYGEPSQTEQIPS